MPHYRVCSCLFLRSEREAASKRDTLCSRVGSRRRLPAHRRAHEVEMVVVGPDLKTQPLGRHGNGRVEERGLLIGQSERPLDGIATVRTRPSPRAAKRKAEGALKSLPRQAERHAPSPAKRAPSGPHVQILLSCRPARGARVRSGPMFMCHAPRHAIFVVQPSPDDLSLDSQKVGNPSETPDSVRVFKKPELRLAPGRVRIRPPIRQVIYNRAPSDDEISERLDENRKPQPLFGASSDRNLSRCGSSGRHRSRSP